MLYICVLLLLCEFFVGLFSPQHLFKYTELEAAPQFYNQSDYLPYQLRPLSKVDFFNVIGEFNVSVKINSLGYRDKEFSIEKEKNITRILFLGDSFTHGFGVELNETYLKIFENLINKKEIIRYETINAGYKAGYCPATYYLYFKKEGVKLNPDIIVMGLFIGNDFEDQRDLLYFIDSNGSIEKIKSKNLYVDERHRLRTLEKKVGGYKGILYKINVFLSFHSHFYVLFKESFRKALLIFYSGRPPPNVYSKNYPKYTANEINETLFFIKELNLLAKEKGITLVVVGIPREEAVYKTKIRDNENNFFEWEKPSILLNKFSKENNITFIDLLPSLREYTLLNKTKVYFDADPHWNKQGHFITGNILASEFEQRNLLK